MKRSKTVLLMFVAAGVMSGCEKETKPNGLRYRKDAQGQVVKDAQGNPLYEDDEGQQYRYSGGYFFPLFTRMSGFNTIPGSGITAPASSGPLRTEDITSRRVPVSRGGFGGSGVTRSSGSAGGSFGS